MLPFMLAALIAAPDDCNRPPRVVKQAQLEYPDDTELLGPGLLEVILKLSIDEHGNVTKTEVIESSGYDAFDNATIRAVNQSTYEPAEVACSPSPSYAMFKAEFQNKYVNDNGEITPPTFTFPDGWIAPPPTATTPLPDGMNTVAEYTHGDERVIIISEHPHGAFDGQGAAAAITAALHMQPTGARNGPMTICSGFQGAWSENFDYAAGAQTRTAHLVEVQGANGRFSLVYTMPKDAPVDDPMFRAIERFCVQGAPPPPARLPTMSAG
jgi:TonB family protein